MVARKIITDKILELNLFIAKQADVLRNRQTCRSGVMGYRLVKMTKDERSNLCKVYIEQKV